ncbi:MAG: hypothetical protein ACM3JD_02310 [Rudaea sp.]
MADEKNKDKKNQKDVEKKFSPVSENAEKKKDSGSPGGGAGRVEQVRGSGVYPASGPLPEENAPYKGEESWGQGQRGEAGYGDSGDSELTSFGSVSDLGGAPNRANVTRPSGEEQPASEEPTEPRKKPDLKPEDELPSGEDAHDRRAEARKNSQ